MTKLTKLLPAAAAPAQTLLDKAHALPLTSAERAELPRTIATPEGEVEVAVAAEQLRPLEVNDVFVDETGAFWAVRPSAEKVLHVTGDVNVLREAAGALINRGVRIAQIENGFSVLPLPSLSQMLTMVGLEVAEAEEPFDPIQFKPAPGGCGCGCGGHHHHHHDGECGCGHHHHHHEEGECCCGHDHHHEEGECCCGHDHHHEEGECGCGHQHHHEEGECCCGHDHHHEEGECCCGHDHHHEDGECGCGHHHHHEEGECCCEHDHHHEEGECCCGHDHHHDECCCGHDHHHEKGECACGCGGEKR